MTTKTISEKDVLASVIHANYSVLMVLDRMKVKLGLGNKTIEEVAEQYNIKTGAFLLILNLFINKKYILRANEEFDYIPDILMYLKSSHSYFLEEKIPAVQESINELVDILQDSKAEMVKQFYNNYIEEITEHIEYENETVFPYVEQLYAWHIDANERQKMSTDFGINIYDEHHENIEDVLTDLKNILIRHLPQEEEGNLRPIVLKHLFELESDLFSHTRIEDDVLIPLVKKLENQLGEIA